MDLPFIVPPFLFEDLSLFYDFLDSEPPFFFQDLPLSPYSLKKPTRFNVLPFVLLKTAGGGLSFFLATFPSFLTCSISPPQSNFEPSPSGLSPAEILYDPSVSLSVNFAQFLPPFFIKVLDSVPRPFQPTPSVFQFCD